MPTKQFFTNKILSWQSVFYYFNKWSKNGCWQKVWINILSSNRQYLDLSSNADSGFDGETFYKAYENENIIPSVKPNPRNNSEQQRVEPYQRGTHIFDDELYKDRSVIEHSNAWIDGFKALLVRFEFSVKNWMSLHFIAFSVTFLRKINKKIN